MRRKTTPGANCLSRERISVPRTRSKSAPGRLPRPVSPIASARSNVRLPHVDVALIILLRGSMVGRAWKNETGEALHALGMQLEQVEKVSVSVALELLCLLLDEAPIHGRSPYSQRKSLFTEEASIFGSRSGSPDGKYIPTRPPRRLWVLAASFPFPAVSVAANARIGYRRPVGRACRR